MKPFLWLIALVIVGLPPARGEDARKGGENDETLKALEGTWAEAIVKRDLPVIDRILSEDFVLITPEGRLASKAQVLQNLRSPADPTFVIKGADPDKFRVRVFGDTAVLSSRFTLKVQSEGRTLETPFRHTDVFVRRDGRWQCVARQATRIRQSYGHEGGGDDSE